MAKASWLSLNPESGSGNASVVNTVEQHTGREQRTTTVTGIATDVNPNKEYTVIQQATEEFVEFTSSSVTVSKDGGSLTVTGKSNSSKLTFALVYGGVDDPDTADKNESLQLSLPATYNAGGATVNNGEEIPNDPGASAEFEFSVTFTDIPANKTIQDLIEALKVTANGGQTAQVEIVQTAGDPYFEFESETITLNAAGDAVTQKISSNTSWTLE